jgi:hypothetical protein
MARKKILFQADNMPFFGQEKMYASERIRVANCLHKQDLQPSHFRRNQTGSNR